MDHTYLKFSLISELVLYFEYTVLFIELAKLNSDIFSISAAI